MAVTRKIAMLVCPPFLAALALTPRFALAEQLPIRLYTTADRLARDQINRIVRDSHGFLWSCTEEGLSQFDGYTLIGSLRSTMESAEEALRAFGEEALRENVQGLDGKTMSKLRYLYLYITHEMYHRGR